MNKLPVDGTKFRVCNVIVEQGYTIIVPKTDDLRKDLCLAYKLTYEKSDVMEVLRVWDPEDQSIKLG
jgi:hypothetical protein